MKSSVWPSLIVFFALFMFAGQSTANTAVQPVPKGERWMERHQAMSERAAKGEIDLLFLGDSITDYWPQRAAEIWDREFSQYRHANFGISADRTQHLLWRLKNGIGEGFQPKVIVLLIGTNNTGFEPNSETPRNSTEEAIEGISAVVAEIRERFGDAKLLLFGLFPRGDVDNPQREQIRIINRHISRFHDGETIHYFEIGGEFLDEEGNIPPQLMPDKLHPASKGYEIWASALREPLSQWLYPTPGKHP